jgi:hypothetical protein
MCDGRRNGAVYWRRRTLHDMSQLPAGVQYVQKTIQCGGGDGSGGEEKQGVFWRRPNQVSGVSLPIVVGRSVFVPRVWMDTATWLLLWQSHATRSSCDWRQWPQAGFVFHPWTTLSHVLWLVLEGYLPQICIPEPRFFNNIIHGYIQIHIAYSVF